MALSGSSQSRLYQASLGVVASELDFYAGFLFGDSDGALDDAQLKGAGGPVLGFGTTKDHVTDMPQQDVGGGM